MGSYLIYEIIITPSFLIFFLLYICRFIIVIGSNDFLMIWIGLEVNMVRFLFLFYRRKRIINVESCMKYFFVQRLGSALFIRILYLWRNTNWDYVRSCILGYKLGAGPFFFWFPSVVGGLDWVGGYFLITFQKILPLILLIIFVSWFLWVILILSLVIGVFGSFNQSKMKILFAYSSVHHLGWLLMCEIIDRGVWIFYLLMYRIILSIVFIIYYYEVERFMRVIGWKNKWWFFLGIISMAGIPPLLGFFLKWLAFYYILNMNYFIITFILFISIIIFYIYVRVVYDIVMGGALNFGWIYKIYKFNFFLNLDFYIFLGVFLAGVLGLLFLI